jgi:hypothetical protein
MTECEFSGYSASAMRVMKTKFPDRRVLTDCTFSGNELWLDSDCHPETTVTLDGQQRDVAARRFDAPGAFYEAWNASVTEM